MKQTLTKDQLISLYNAFFCITWKSEINSILISNLHTVGTDYEIPESSIKLLIEDGNDEQKKLITDLGIELPKGSREMYIENQANSGLAVGDKVKVLRKAENNENGWSNNWLSEMNDNIGKIVNITDFEKFGVNVKESDYSYPYFVLEKVVDEYIPFDYNDDLVGKIIKSNKPNGTVVHPKLLITKQDSISIRVADYSTIFTYGYLLENYVFLNGDKCGKLKK